MGQTLTHGVYLPSEGERNCYSGLASNWRLLDGAIGTVAAHTTAIAEKAPLVHTHTKADITDFPAYGTTAGTICEGNDSRLSDARTPVAHTHIKSDVTDLLNSNFIPSANNSYDLGSSSYQWNNIYAKNYYYNGVAWGLDKQNEWAIFQRMTSNPAVWYLRNNTVTLGSVPSSNRYIGMFFEDVNGADLGYASFQANKNSYNSIMFSLRNSDGTNAYIGVLRYRASTTGAYCFFPETSECDLGISTNKWKTLNGINPGALSLPDMGNVENTNYFDFSGSITHLDGTDNFYTPTVNGWMTVIIAGTSLSLFVDASSGQAKDQGVGISAAPVNGFCLATIPVRKNYRVKIQATGTSIYMAFVRPNLGNV